MKEKNISDEPKVVILLTTYKDPPLLKNILESIRRTEYSNLELLVVDCGSSKMYRLLQTTGLSIPIQYVALKKDEGAAHQLNKGMWLAIKKDVKYIVRLEGDAIPQGRGWLRELVNVMENNKTIAVAMPFDIDRNGNIGCGGKLYGNCTFCTHAFLQSKISKIVPCIGTGGHCFITRKTYIEELFMKGVKPYWTQFYISSEDIDFNLKPWLRSYKVVTVGSVKVLHEGTSMPKDQSYRAPYRIYHMYKNRVCLLLLNFGYKHIAINIWYRLLHDLLSALIYSELIPMIKGYLWVLVNLRKIFEQRNLRMARWKLVPDEELKDIVLSRLPMPVKG
jgi:GT2 family glycosyltransferase